MSDLTSNPSIISGARTLLFNEINATAKQLKAALSGRQSSGVLPILQILARAPQTVPQIARLRVSSRQSVQILVNRLSSQGLVSFIGNPAHKRSPLVHLAQAGRALLASAAEREGQLLESLLPGISQTEILPIASMLRKIREVLERQRSGLIPKLPAAEQYEIEPAPDMAEEGFPVNLL